MDLGIRSRTWMSVASPGADTRGYASSMAPPRSTNALRRRQSTPQVDGREVRYFFEVTLTCVDTPDGAATSTSRQSECVENVQAAFPASLPLYDRMITEGAWWDLVDETATHLICPLVVGYPQETWQVVDEWINDEDIWFRRAALICQIGAKEATEAERLFRFCEVSAHDTEFFIRKAIGWALREHAKTDPQAVAGFVTEHRDTLSGLSFREATKHIGELVG